MATSKVKRVSALLQGCEGGYVSTHKLILLEDGTQIHDELLVVEGNFNNEAAFVEPGDTVEYETFSNKKGYKITKIIFKD